jgi:N-hydroxyarylamine O-acetyltransferase
MDDADFGRYLSRIGVAASDVRRQDVETLERLQRAHVTTVPFETLSITGDPYGERDGEGVTLSLPALYEKVVERRRGGFCYELNGLFGWLLDELGFDVERRAARVVSDGEARPPANHLTTLVSLDRPYLADVGMGTPVMRRPLPLDGTVREDEAGVRWRVAASDRPDTDYVSQFRTPDEETWTDRFVFRDVPRELDYFEATCEFLQRAPESPFTGDPVVSIADDEGHRKLTPGTLTERPHGETTETSLVGEAWHDALEREFGVRYRDGAEK